ncbi:hypothetical protein JCM4814A_09700 [Streptomyces phaeofaciens JCM 4814]|uniref:Uncharacterized protein n=1 Tax=Streptomyces phaeofaciens TaxID=68254 RepID=A0A918HLB6_9ACTN|nr:hypothetical protein GCM10010226_52640 [Streptomyces phaeofaciens]
MGIITGSLHLTEKQAFDVAALLLPGKQHRHTCSDHAEVSQVLQPGEVLAAGPGVVGQHPLDAVDS